MLHEIAQYPDSGVAARYKRLGLSVRQGEKRKARLLDSGLAVERLEVMTGGKLRTVQLTEQGRIPANG